MKGSEIMKDDFQKYLDKQLKDSEFKKERDSSEVERELIKSLIEARNRGHITQKQLSELTGIAQSDISQIETGNANPTISTLNRLAEGLNTKLKITFVPK